MEKKKKKRNDLLLWSPFFLNMWRMRIVSATCGKSFCQFLKIYILVYLVHHHWNCTNSNSLRDQAVINKYWRLPPAAAGGFSPQPWIDVFIPSFVLNSNVPFLITFSCKRFLIYFHIILMWRWACFRVKRFFFSFFSYPCNWVKINK